MALSLRMRLKREREEVSEEEMEEEVPLLRHRAFHGREGEW